MKKTKIWDSIDPKIKFSIEESSEVDGVNILAKVKGVFFVPNGVSRNNRFYSKGLWEKALSEEDVINKFKNKNMFGTVGHNVEITDETLGEGKISHVVTNAYIDEEGRGIGEALILNTPSGKILNTVLRAGSVLYVSSRGEGTFKGDRNGVPAIDENSYGLKGWDFVINPGFLKANPSIAEALDEVNNTENKEGDKPMEKTMVEKTMEKVLERLNNELFDAKSKYESSLKEKSSLSESVSTLSEENNHVKSELAKCEASLTETEKELVKVKEELAKFKTLGESFGSVKRALVEADAYITKIHTQLGSFDKIKRALTTSLAFKESVDAIGSVSEIKETMRMAESLVSVQESRETEDRVANLSKKLGVGGEAVGVLAAKGLSDSEITGLLKKVSESVVKPTKTAKKSVNESLVKKTKKAEVIEENNENDKPNFTKQSRLNRIMESFN